MSAAMPPASSRRGPQFLARNCFSKSRICGIGLSIGQIKLVRLRRPDESGETAFVHNPEREFRSKRLFYFFGHNLLKSPNSTKEIQLNPSFFPWFSLDLLARNSPDGCIRWP
jgi:hypothetical protein